MKSFKELLAEKHTENFQTTNYTPVRMIKMDFSDKDAAHRIITHAARRVIRKHKKEIENLKD